MMKIKVSCISVDDQEKALRFYTVASPEEPNGVELQLASNDNPAAGHGSKPPEDVTGDRRADASRVLNLSGDT